MTAVLYVVVAALVLGVFMGTWGFRGDNPRYGFDALIDRSAARPFCYRVLSPAIVRAAADRLPERVIEAHRQWFLNRSSLLRYRQEGERWDLTKAVRWHVAYIYLFVCLVGVELVGRRLVRVYLPTSAVAADLAPALSLLFLPLTFCYGGYLYDIPEILLLLACLVVIGEGRWWALYPVFALTLLNKEADVVVLAYVFALGLRRMPLRRLTLRLCLLAALALAVFFTVHTLCAHGPPGSAARLNLADNLRFWTSPETYLATFSPVSPLIRLPRGANLINLLALALVLTLAWRDLPPDLRRLTAIVLPLEACLLVLFGYHDEIRALAPAFPVVALNGLFAARRVFLRVAPSRETG